MKATIIQFRRGRKTFKPRHFLIEIDGSETRELLAETPKQSLTHIKQDAIREMANSICAGATHTIIMEYADNLEKSDG